MKFLRDYFRFCSKQLNRSAIVIGVLLIIAASARARFDLQSTIFATPAGLIISFVAVYAVSALGWFLAVAAEARSRNTSFRSFIESPEYGIYLQKEARQMAEGKTPKE